ncbi:MAG: IS110 family transposase [Pyrinomonadaceae bacterium]
MTLYIGVDFHPHQQTVCLGDTVTGETRTIDLKHDLERVREFYTSLPEPAVIGVEASAKAHWFENMLTDTGHKLFVGNPVLIRKRATSRHKNDRRNAQLILELLMRGEFPALWRRKRSSDQVLEILRLRQSLVGQRTQVYNRLQAMAHNVGLPKGRMRTAAYQAVLKALEMDEAGALGRSQLFSLLEHLNTQIREFETWLRAKAEAQSQVQLLLTQRGVGYLSALATLHTLGDVSRFTRLAKQVTGFVGLDPLERSSAGKVRFGSISKAGSPLLRYQLGMSALIATRFDSKLKSFYKRLAKKKPKPVAKTATARKLLVKLAIMLRDNITADEFDQRGRTVGNARKTQGLQ